MIALEEHPTVVAYRQKERQTGMLVVHADEIRRIALAAGADDVGYVRIERAELDDERKHILKAMPAARALISIVSRMNREPIRSTARSVANLEFHRTGDHVDDVAHRIVAELESRGVRALNPAMGFPMEMDGFPGRGWVISHKPIAVAAGLGRMGLHRNVIHPKFGNFILLGTVIIDAEISSETQPIDYNPCLDCRLCVAACPVGAIDAGGAFDFGSCYTHNYREFMGGFSDWVENVVASGDVADYRKKVSPGETASMWQSLSFGANYKAAYCMAVCPAGEDVIGPFLHDRKQFLDEVVRPLQNKVETVYVKPESDAEEHVAKRFPHKKIKRVGNGIRLTSIAGFLEALPRTFSAKRANGLRATYHFTFTGSEEREATVTIGDGLIDVRDGHEGTADLQMTADAQTWLAILRKEQGIAGALLRRKVKVKGSPKLLLAFGKSFAI
ncbi:MAG TPA: SCP2 sterol-binding domain-containing protein [Thermoanaerobaculia bacterium]